MNPLWRQVFIHFDIWSTAERTAVTELAPMLTEAEEAGLALSWFFIRKAPCWRVRFLIHDEGIAHEATARIHRQLDALHRAGRIAHWVENIYEPETYAFGGTAAMHTAHQLFHQDSQQILAYLGNDHAAGEGHRGQRRELSILLCSVLLRNAGQDWYEQGDVWARVAEHRTQLPDIPPNRLRALESSVRRLMTVDIAALVKEQGPLAFASDWVAAFDYAGTRLGELASTGTLSRGLRSVLAHHVLFAWNRIGLSHSTQSLLANTAKAVVLDQ